MKSYHDNLHSKLSMTNSELSELVDQTSKFVIEEGDSFILDDALSAEIGRFARLVRFFT